MINPKLIFALLVILLAAGGVAYFILSGEDKEEEIHVHGRVMELRDLARLETLVSPSSSVIDMRSAARSTYLGLYEERDVLLLIAVGEVVAGVDLEKLRDGDIEYDEQRHWVRVVLPPPEIFSAHLDEELTHPFLRETRSGNLIFSGETADEGGFDTELETRARRSAVEVLRRDFVEHGYLQRACANAIKMVEGMYRSVGYVEFDITCRSQDESIETELQ